MNDERLSGELLHLLGAEDFLKLVERYGGTRLYVSGAGRSLSRALGRAGAQALASRYQGSYIRVPLARSFRARTYRESGLSNAEIARRLGVTETGVDKIFARMDEKPAKGSQLDLFDAPPGKGRPRRSLTM